MERNKVRISSSTFHGHLDREHKRLGSSEETLPHLLLSLFENVLNISKTKRNWQQDIHQIIRSKQCSPEIGVFCKNSPRSRGDQRCETNARPFEIDLARRNLLQLQLIILRNSTGSKLSAVITQRTILASFQRGKYAAIQNNISPRDASRVHITFLTDPHRGSVLLHENNEIEGRIMRRQSPRRRASTKDFSASTRVSVL